MDEDPDAITTPDEPSGGGDPDASATEVGDEPWERPVDKFKRSTAGSVLAAGLLGVRDALEGRPKQDEPAIVSEAPEPKLDHIDIVLDPEHPERSRATVFLPPRDHPRDDPPDDTDG